MSSEINEENHDATPIPAHYAIRYGSPRHCQQTMAGQWRIAVKMCVLASVSAACVNSNGKRLS